jgi:RNA polymerase sigma-70 factor (ECF subfamily)
MRKRNEFERLILPHLPAAYNLARWLTRHPQDAEDAVQDAFLRACRGFDRFAGGDPASWLLAIVRNTCLTALGKSSRWRNVVRLETAARGDPREPVEAVPDAMPGPDEQLHAKREAERLRAAIAALPDPLREVIVLRELEEFSYAQIAHVVDVPIGTVMSRLSRGRKRLHEALADDEPGRRHEL